jgi:hypothetical protein
MIFRRLITSTVAVAATLMIAAYAGADTLIDKLLSIAGLTAAPAQLRGPGDEVSVGNIWIADLERRTATALTADGGYRSPIFSLADENVYALKGDAIVRFSQGRGNAAVVQKVPGALKLVGFDPKSADEVVVLLDAGTANSPLAIVSLKSGTMTPLPYNAKSEEQQQMLALVRGQRRVYGDTSVYTRTESKRGLSRTIEWTDVYVRRGDEEPRNVSACGGVNCAQPALSRDGRRLAFIKTGG